MPTPDLGPRRSSQERLRVARERAFVRDELQRVIRRRKRGGKRDDGNAGESVPVVPKRPFNLSGGAAAALEFDV